MPSIFSEEDKNNSLCICSFLTSQIRTSLIVRQFKIYFTLEETEQPSRFDSSVTVPEDYKDHFLPLDSYVRHGKQLISRLSNSKPKFGIHLSSRDKKQLKPYPPLKIYEPCHLSQYKSEEQRILDARLDSQWDRCE